MVAGNSVWPMPAQRQCTLSGQQSAITVWHVVEVDEERDDAARRQGVHRAVVVERAHVVVKLELLAFRVRHDLNHAAS